MLMLACGKKMMRLARSRCGLLLIFSFFFSDVQGAVSIQEFTPAVTTFYKGEHGFAFMQEDESGNTVLHLRGSPYEKGYQQGFLLKEKLSQVYDTVFSNLAWAYGMSEELLLNYLLTQGWAKAVPFVGQPFLAEMEGMADGSGIPLFVIEAAAVLPDMEMMGCSNFVVFGAVTSDGSLLHGRNFDFPMWLGFNRHPVVILRYSDSYDVSADIGFVGQVGSLTGMKQGGLTVAIDDLYGSYYQTMHGTPRTLLVRDVLEKDTLAEAVACLQNAQRTVGTIYVLSSCWDNDARAVETDSVYAIPRETGDPEGIVFYDSNVLIATNFAFSREFGQGGGYDRYNTLAWQIQQNYGTVDVEKSISFLQAVSMSDFTLQSVVFRPWSSDFWVASAVGITEATRNTFQHYNLNKLVDSDGDSLPDIWEYQYFNSLTQSPQDDPDEDSFVNIDEFYFGTNPTDPFSSPHGGQLGDIDKNGIVDISDVILCLRMAIGLDQPDQVGDMNQDGLIDIGDVILILRKAIGLINLIQK